MKQEREIGDEVKKSKECVEKVQKELEQILSELGDAKVDKHEDSRRRKKSEIVDHFKKLYPGVVRNIV